MASELKTFHRLTSNWIEWWLNSSACVTCTKPYKFTSSYEAFCDLTAEEIGNLLMEKIYTIPNNMVYVNETVFKYCDEVRLDRDTLLLNYIKKADLSKIVNICIDMCKLFANDDFRAEAAMMIAPSRQLPWSPDMNQLFNNLIGLQTLPEMTQIQLKETRLRADISALMKPFGGDCLLEIEDSHDLLNYCTTMFSHTSIPIEERVDATHQICALSKQNTKITITPTECFVRAIKYSYATSHSTEQLDQTLCLLKHIKDLDVREEVARKCAVYAHQLLSTNSILDESIPLCAYFLIKISQYLTADLKASYVKKATLICQLYELYRVVVFADKLNNTDECAQTLISISATNEEGNSSRPH
ncbi:WD40-repeat-containing domain-containing protein [Aphelenchoides bicaudatus]|nr:WD40-repeat-containing domain-containing protein [Aphelenchoides bicaudatus]